MGALLTRATIAERRDRYLCPLAATQVPPETLDAYLAIARASGPPQRVERARPDGTREHLADAYECHATLSALVDGWRAVTWTERRLLLRSLAQAQAQETALRARVARTQQAITALTVRRRGKPRLATRAVQQAADAVLARYDVGGLVQVAVTEQVYERPARSTPRPSWTRRLWRQRCSGWAGTSMPPTRRSRISRPRRPSSPIARSI